jgi:hypothetical protein
VAGEAFEFKPPLFQVGGGLLPRPDLNALLLVTHPGGARSLDYEDGWEGDTLVYTGQRQDRQSAFVRPESMSARIVGTSSFWRPLKRGAC